MLISMIAMLAFSAVCSAANGKVLEAEEAAAGKFLEAKNYAAASAVMSDEMKQNFTEKTFENFLKFKTEIGAQKLQKLRVVQFLDDAHVLVYQVQYEKAPINQFTFVFKADEGKPMLLDFGMSAPAPKKEEAAEAQAK